ncbi:MAG: ABC-F type ribosomal protection protein [Oscillospiraceae bacterium]|jgi:lincosamide and streptogramin A transport system ATP-binding/permease protein|nr:ABC-F type ribosomal protection protein [Oscillospiraceae bacterium]
MSTITVSNLTFAYSGSYDNIFENVSFTLDTNWKLGFIGRNGRGKTTFLKLLQGIYDYSGKIFASVNFDYFPFKISDKNKNTAQIAFEIYPDYQQWELEREISLLNMDEKILTRPFKTLSNGEQTKVLLTILFLKDNNFLLIDEPTNHLDAESREVVSKYLKSKKGFILVSHDRTFLDSCIDHVLSINRSNIEVQQCNFSSWWRNKEYQDNFELAENEKLKRDIKRLEKSAKQTANWSDKVEATKFGGKRDSGLKADRGYIGHKSAKMMKRSISAQNRKEKAVEDKSKLLKNLEIANNLKLNPLIYRKNKLIEISNLSIFYAENTVCENINFEIENGDRIQLKGRNGCGKSSILKLILGENIKYSGALNIANDLKISYVSQDTSSLKSDLTSFAKNNNIDESLFKAILRKLDFSRIQFEKNIQDFSGGQKKKVLIAKSLCEMANLYIWDEPLNFIDVYSRIQIEDLILEYKPTMIFVEHDKMFAGKIGNKVVKII